MRPLLSLLTLACISLHGCAVSPSPGDPHAPTSDLKIDGDDVTLSFTGLPLGEFLKLAQTVTPEVYTYDSRQLAGVEPLSLVGKVRCNRAAFPDFVATMLHMRGLRTEATDAGGLRVLQVVPITNLPGESPEGS